MQDDPRVDRCRGAVYQAEDTVASVMARAHRAVRLGRRIVTLPADTRFATVEEIQSFADRVLDEPATVSAYPRRGRVRIEARRGFRSATYNAGVVRVPAVDPRGRWALSRAVVLHELAHHLAAEPGHTARFRQTLVHLYRLHLGDGAAELLAHLFAPIDDIPDVVGAADDGQIRRVGALLAKAQATTSAEEAEAYLAKAALVAQRHSVDLAVASMARGSQPESPTHRMLTIGPPRRTLNKLLVTLLVSIARAWPVRVDIGPGSTFVLVYGLPADLDQVESVFATASSLMATRAHEHVKSGRWRGTTYRPPGSPTDRPVTSSVARNAFCMGFIDRLGQKVREAAHQARSFAPESGGSPDLDGADRARAELALRTRELAVADYHRSTSRARGSWRGSTSAAGSALNSRRAGERAAEEYGRRSLRDQRPAIGS